MGKRVVIGLVVAMGLFVLFGADAGAATCLQYRRIGGSNVCVAWSTKGVLFEITFKDACVTPSTDLTSESFVSGCIADARATSNDNVAFCQVGSNIVRVPNCGAAVTFTGSVNSGDPVSCVPKHEQDVTGEGGVGHEHHGCTARTALQTTVPFPDVCQSCCASVSGTCIDVTPVEMDTEVDITAAGGSSESGDGSCSPDSDTCHFEEHCSINPRKIQFVNPADPNLTGSKDYQCNLQCVGSECFTD